MLFQPLTIERLVPSQPASSSTVRHVNEGTATSLAAGVAEGGTKPESTLGLSTKDEPIKEIAIKQARRTPRASSSLRRLVRPQVFDPFFRLIERADRMSERALYEVQLRFSVNARRAPPRKALHGALETLRTVIVEASSIEEAEAQVDQIRVALETQADGRAIVDRISQRRRARQPGGHRRWR